mmetsp:Transcript_10843/g.14097  ORF Transcript_10843/g.14097 Transcript_10843/m.14097 type:complete len:257 (+) Transcript_10843:92-862(+)
MQFPRELVWITLAFIFLTSFSTTMSFVVFEDSLQSNSRVEIADTCYHRTQRKWIKASPSEHSLQKLRHPKKIRYLHSGQNKNGDEENFRFDEKIETFSSSIIEVLNTKIGPSELGLRLLYVIPLVGALGNKNFVYPPIFFIFLTLARSVEAPDYTAVLAALLTTGVLSPSLVSLWAYGGGGGEGDWVSPLLLFAAVGYAVVNVGLGKKAQELEMDDFTTSNGDVDDFLSDNNNISKSDPALRRWDNIFREKQDHQQ